VARLLVTAASLLAFAASAGAGPVPVLVLDRTSAQANDRVTVRTRAYQPGTRLYLVRREAVQAVRSRFDRRLSFVGTFQRNGGGRGVLAFSMPPLDAGTYQLVSWRHGRDLVQHSAQLRLRTTTSCPVTNPNGNQPPGQPRDMTWYGNGFLWAGVERDGTYTVTPDRVGADGSIGNKLLWVTTPPWEKPTVSGERIDTAASPLRVFGVNTGSFSGAANPSHMTPVGYPTTGCWRLTARLGDLSLVYVVRVEVAGG
jgi:hypothetical protein